MKAKQHDRRCQSTDGLVPWWLLLLMTSFGTWGLPQMVHKYYGIRDDREVKRGTVISTFFALAGGGRRLFHRLLLPSVFYGDALPEGGKDYIIPNMLNMAGLPNILIGIVLVLLDFRIGLHALQHYADGLLHGRHGFGERRRSSQR